MSPLDILTEQIEDEQMKTSVRRTRVETVVETNLKGFLDLHDCKYSLGVPSRNLLGKFYEILGCVEQKFPEKKNQEINPEVLPHGNRLLILEKTRDYSKP